MAKNISIWPGSSSFAPGDTPFGLYDNDGTFQLEAEKTATWCTKRLGYPIVDIELQAQGLFACFEEAVTEYGAQVNRFNIRENLLAAKGTGTGSELSQKLIHQNLDSLIQMSKEYGSEAGSGGRLNWYSGSISITSGSQVYDLTDNDVTTYESGTVGTDAI